MGEVLSSGLIAAVVSAIVTLVTSRKKLSIEYVTGDRRQWREEIRKIADALNGSSYAGTLKQLNKLKVRINAYGEYAIKSTRCDSHIWELIHEIEEKPLSGEELQKKQRMMVQYLSLMLKYDWERCKNEVKGDLYSICGWTLIVLSLIAYGLHGIVLGENVLSQENRYEYVFVNFLIAVLMLGMISILKWLVGKITGSEAKYWGSMLELYIFYALEGILVIVIAALWGFFLKQGYDSALLQNEEMNIAAIVINIKGMCFVFNMSGLYLLAIRNMEKEQQEYYLGKAVCEIQKAAQGEKGMGKKGMGEKGMGEMLEKKEIISKKIIIGGIIVVVLLAVLVFIMEWKGTRTFLTQHLGEATVWIQTIEEINIGNMMAIETALLIGAVTALAFIITFLQTRYLGANYKYWIFKERIYKLLPQEMIVMMLFAIAGTGIGYLFKNGFIALVCYGVSWWMFILLLQRVYIAVVKVSRMFEKLNKKICNGNVETRKKWCDSIYKKLYYLEKNDGTHNSYIEEEKITIKNLIKTYEGIKKETPNDEVKKDAEEKCKELQQILAYIVKCEDEYKFNRPWKVPADRHL